jgi:hypothetical protein
MLMFPASGNGPEGSLRQPGVHEAHHRAQGRGVRRALEALVQGEFTCIPPSASRLTPYAAHHLWARPPGPRDVGGGHRGLVGQQGDGAHGHLGL